VFTFLKWETLIEYTQVLLKGKKLHADVNYFVNNYYPSLCMADTCFLYNWAQKSNIFFNSFSFKKIYQLFCLAEDIDSLSILKDLIKKE